MHKARIIVVFLGQIRTFYLFSDGEILGVEADRVITKKGTVDKDKFSLPKDLVERYDGHKVWFKISQEDAQRFQRY